MNAIAVGVVVFGIAAAHDAVVVGDQERSEPAVGVIAEVVNGEDFAGKGVDKFSSDMFPYI